MPISTKDYLIEKKAIQESIDWLSKTIDSIDRQQDVRRARLQFQQENLFSLEKEYYTNGSI